jgi:CHAT domain-containing protein/tetratricopeptide (TPR) repeat protein
MGRRRWELAPLGRIAAIAALAGSGIAFSMSARGDDAPAAGAESADADADAAAGDSNPVAASAAGAEGASSDPAPAAAPDDAARRDERNKLWTEAERLRSGEYYARAAEVGEQMLAYELDWQGPASRDAEYSMEWLADVYAKAGDWERSAARLSEALQWCERNYGPENYYTVNLRWSVARARRLVAASPGQRRVIVAAYEANKSLDYLFIDNKFDDMLPVAEHAVKYTRRVWGDQHPDVAASLYHLSHCYFGLGNYRRAEELGRESLEIRKKLLGPNHPDYAQSLYLMGEIFQETGEYVAAMEAFRKALDIRREAFGDKSSRYAISLVSVAGIHLAMGEYDLAEPLYEEAMMIKEKNGEQDSLSYLECQAARARIEASRGRDAAALKLFTLARDHARDVFGEDNLAYAERVSDLAGYYASQGDYDQAETLYREALRIERAIYGIEHARFADLLAALSDVYLKKGSYELAEPLLVQCVTSLRASVGDRNARVGDALAKLADINEFLGDFARAEAMRREAFEIVTAKLDSMALLQDERRQLALAEQSRDRLDRYLSNLIRQSRGGDAAFSAILRWKGATLLRQRDARAAADSPELKPLFDELQAAVRQISTLASAPALGYDGRMRLAQLEERRRELASELSRRSAAYRTADSSDQLAALRAALPEDVALVDYFVYQQAMPSTTAPGEYSVKESLLASVVRRGQAVAVHALGDTRRTNICIEAWRRGLGATPAARMEGRILRRRLWEPLLEEIGDAKLVLISPDGALGKLPFGALPGSRPDSYLLEDLGLAIVPMPQLVPSLVASTPPQKLPRDLLVIGGVDYNRRAGGDAGLLADASPRALPWERARGKAAIEQALTAKVVWKPLDGTASEASYIAGLYQRLMGLPEGSPRIAFLHDADATEAAFRELAPESYLLHVATHGFSVTGQKPSVASGPRGKGGVAAADNPFGDRLSEIERYSPGLLSGLVFAGANNPPPLAAAPAEGEALPDDGILSADEIASLPLAHAQLVVLSACESGLGESVGGEGLLGIQRAFQVAGARTTIATLWKVNDEATRRIMEKFYKCYLQEEMSPQQALREAQLWALNNPELVPRGADLPEDDAASPRLLPQYWAAFTLSGDWR